MFADETAEFMGKGNGNDPLKVFIVRVWYCLRGNNADDKDDGEILLAGVLRRSMYDFQQGGSNDTSIRCTKL